MFLGPVVTYEVVLLMSCPLSEGTTVAMFDKLPCKIVQDFVLRSSSTHWPSCLAAVGPPTCSQYDCSVRVVDYPIRAPQNCQTVCVIV